MSLIKILYKAANSLNLYNNNHVTWCVAVNDYRYQKKKEKFIEPKESGAKIHWRFVNTPYDGKVLYDYMKTIKKKKNHLKNHWYNTPFKNK